MPMEVDSSRLETKVKNMNILKQFMHFRKIGIVALVLGIESVSAATVDSTLDEHNAVPGDTKCFSTPSGKCTLRAAIEESNQSGTGSTVLPAGTFWLTLGDLDITRNQTLSGAGAGKTIIDGTGHHRVFEIANSAFGYIREGDDPEWEGRP
jgi:CSLREA domain-containing protein